MAAQPEGRRARLSIDLPPELRRQLKSVAAQLDLSMRDIALEALQREVEIVQQRVRPHLDAVAQAQARLEQRAGPAVEGSERTLEQLRQLSPALVERFAAIQAQTARALEEQARLCAQAAAAIGRQQTASILAALPSRPDQAKEIIEHAAEQRAAFQKALEQMRAAYEQALARVQAEQVVAIRRELDPFARDWESEEDAVYDDLR